MNSFYPIMLNLSGKRIVVIGGGRVAERKIAGLIASNADVTVISPQVSIEINRLASTRKINWLAKAFSADDIKGAFMIFAATNDMELNQSIKAAAEDWQLVAIADHQEGSDFQVPARVQRGRLTIAVSTGGASPTLARQLRKQLEQEFDIKYEDYLEFLYEARRQILKEVTDPAIKSKLLKQIVSPDFFNSETRQEDFKAIVGKWVKK